VEEHSSLFLHRGWRNRVEHYMDIVDFCTVYPSIKIEHTQQCLMTSIVELYSD
jgi:hypothetical protein